MRKSVFWVIPLVSAAVLGAANDYLSARRKVDQIEGGRLRAGTRIELSARELNAFIQQEAPQGVRGAKVELVAPGVASGVATVDFNKLQRGQGHEPGWLLSRLLEGEHPVSVTARIRSGGGFATVDIEKVEIAGVEIDGKTVDFLIQAFIAPRYPDATVGKPFEMAYRIDRLDVKPSAVAVVIGR